MHTQDVQGLPLNWGLIRQYLLDRNLFPSDYIGTRDDYRSRVHEEHKRLGGLPATAKSPDELVPNVLSRLKGEGLYKNLGGGRWQPEKDSTDDLDSTVEEADRTIGSGEEKVYAWYLPNYKELAKERGNSKYRMKIGFTAGSISMRIRNSAGMLPEEPKIGLIFHTDHGSGWERIIHGLLDIKGRRVNDAVGTEWYETSPDELVALVQLQTSWLSEHEDS